MNGTAGTVCRHLPEMAGLTVDEWRGPILQRESKRTRRWRAEWPSDWFRSPWSNGLDDVGLPVWEWISTTSIHFLVSLYLAAL